MKILTVLCQKGGVGKTTFVVNLGKLLSHKGYKTLLIDTDPQGNVSTYLNFDKNSKAALSATDLFENRLEKEIMKVSENLYLIPSNKSIIKHSSEKIIGGSKLIKHKNFLTENGFDLVLIDTPPTISSLTQESLTISDYYLIPSKPEFLAVEGVSQAMDFANETINNVIKADPIFLGVVLNQVDTRRSSFQSFEKELKFLLADKLFNSKISQLTEIADSPFYAKTVLDFNENSKAKLEFIELSNEIFEKVGL